MDERRLVHKVLLKPTPELISCDLIDSDIQTNTDLANNRIEWKRIGPPKAARPTR